jgi:hypothetical protein
MVFNVRIGELAKGGLFNLPYSLARQVEFSADLVERIGAVLIDPEPEP